MSAASRQSAPAHLIAPGTPDDVFVSIEPRQPDWDPALGIPVRRAAPRGKPSPHRLVTIGDSLTQGFQSGAVGATSLCWPMIVAHELGWARHFRRASFEGFGGLPLNIEFVLRHLEARFGERTAAHELPAALLRARRLMDRIEDFWERGPGSRSPERGPIPHHLAVYGWDVRDVLSQRADGLAALLVPPRDQFVHQAVQNANTLAALRVYESCRDTAGRPLTLPEAAQQLGSEGEDGAEGIEMLVVFLGANNALGAVTGLQVHWSGDGYDELHHKQSFNVWRPTHFAREFAALAGQVRCIRARHVILVNVPHVTIAPIARGVATKVRPDSRYFPFYTRPWIPDHQFDPRHDPHLTDLQARAIDSAIDQYNDTIAGAVRDARRDGLDWFVLDLAGLLDRVACRRYLLSPEARPAWWSPYDLSDELADLPPPPDSRFFRSNRFGRFQGGLFSLDGIHPTTIGYGLIAQEIIHVMRRAGVRFYREDGTERTDPVRVDFRRLLRLDTLMSDPPASLDDDLLLLGRLDQALGILRRLMRR